jgi:hypothetical protein
MLARDIDLVQDPLRHGRQQKVKPPPLRDDGLLPEFAFRKSKLGRRPDRPERLQCDRPLLLLLGVAMSQKGLRLLQEGEDDGGDGDENGQDGHNGHVKYTHELHTCLL